MPFITKDRRSMLAADMIPEAELQPGDRCYRHYLKMIVQWQENPSWTTADRIYAEISKKEWSEWPNLAEQRAKELAWQVFFQLRVMPYELLKLTQNGDVT